MWKRELAELLLKAWLQRGEPMKEVTRRIHRPPGWVNRLVLHLKKMYAGENVAVPHLASLILFAEGLGYKLWFELSEEE